MESTTRLHDGVANTVFQKAYLVFDDTVAFHLANRVFDPDADGRDGPIGFCFKYVRMKSSLSAIVGKGQLAYVVYRRLVRGCPSMMRFPMYASKAGSKWDSKAWNAFSVTPVTERKLLARGVTSS